jgi:hypothetical protein
MIPNIIAADKTMYIEAIDKKPEYQFMFLQPRWWGKSTFLQTLLNYYDKTKRSSFEDTFGDLYIGRHPTKDRNSLLVLSFDFSGITAVRSFAETRAGFNEEVHLALEQFLKANTPFLGNPDPQDYIIEDCPAKLLQRVIVSISLI